MSIEKIEIKLGQWVWVDKDADVENVCYYYNSFDKEIRRGNKYTWQNYIERIGFGSERIGEENALVYNTPEEAKEQALIYCLTNLI